ncbi:MAG: phosphoenolpyruvate carboxykinase [Bacteriodetes bacterium]|nr:phosphoenolpyruvate carboxykinase [Bacteroidota bacterium]
MNSLDGIRSSLQGQGITGLGDIFYNLTTAELYEHAVIMGEAEISEHGALLCNTAPNTGRSANDKFVVEEDSSKGNVWWGKVNKPFTTEKFNALKNRVLAYMQGRDVYVLDCMAGADANYKLPVRIVNEHAWHNMFVKNMFIGATAEELANFAPGFTIIHAPNFNADPAIDGTNSNKFIILSFDQKLVLIGGTHYAGEMKKSIFTVLNYMLPLQKVMPMHCSANIGKDGDTALFFGLSGTGKTTLSTDPERALIGDDEHGWSNDGTFNFEGGCYAKVINLSQEAEPIIYATTRTFGTVLENVDYDETSRVIDLNSQKYTENTRASYSRDVIPNIVPDNKGGHPKNVIFLTCDAFGVMPPIAKLTPEQAMFHFLSGYTAKVAGTEAGVKEPSATFSTCFGAPFMVHHPSVYANLLRDKINEHGAHVWLVNTGWSGGAYGVGSRMKIAYTRALLRAALTGALHNVEFVKDEFFNLSIPVACEGVPAEILNPKNTWADKAAYDEKANHLVQLFEDNFKQFADAVADNVKNAMRA